MFLCILLIYNNKKTCNIKSRGSYCFFKGFLIAVLLTQILQQGFTSRSRWLLQILDLMGKVTDVTRRGGWEKGKNILPV
jgi:hypothetical protein